MVDASSPEAVRKRMEQLRAELDQQWGDIAASARTLFDWRYYVRRYPWVCVAGAAALGFLIVPVRAKTTRLSEEQLREIARQARVVVDMPKRASGILGMAAPLATMLAGAAARAAVAHFQKQLGQSRSV
jgi:hypothetical protein